MDWHNTLFSISPLLTLAGFSILILLLDALFPKRMSSPGLTGGSISYFLSILGIILSSYFVLHFWNVEPKYLFYEALRLDRFSLFFTGLSLFLTLLTFLNSSYLKDDFPRGEYSFFLLATCLGMSLMAWSSDLITFFLSLETMSLGAYILTGIQKEKIQSIEGALKYFLLGAFSTGFLLFGIVCIYACTGSTLFSSIPTFLTNAQHTIPPIFYLGLGFLIIGMGFKIGSVPFHMWVPDSYEGAPTPITALMATGVKAASFAALIRLFLVAFLSVKPHWEVLFMVIAIATMTVGNIAALLQTNIKRMLAYSSIAHAGYILIAVVATNAAIFDLSLSAILFYLIAYGLMTIGAFAVVIYAGQHEEKNMIGSYAGFGLKYPLLGLAMTVFMLSFIGIPPTAGFVGKFYIFSAALKAKFFWLALIGIINSIISAYYYLYVLVVFYMKKPEEISAPLIPSFALALVLFVTTLGTVGLGLIPSQMFEMITQTIKALIF